MIFRQIDEILEGRKTQTRRVCKPGDVGIALTEPQFHVIAVATRLPVSREWDMLNGRPLEKIADGHYSTIPTRWYVSNTYAVRPGRGQKAVGRIRITAIRREPLQAIIEADACAEGVESVEEYRALWKIINGKTKGVRWEDNPHVWVLEFELVTR